MHCRPAQSLYVILLLAWESNLGVQELAPSQDDVEREANLVTAASIGIGRMTSELLAESGSFVYVGTRREKDLESWKAFENVPAIQFAVEANTAIQHLAQRDGAQE
ncbi:MAG: hypothetical protein QM477_04935 [Planctomycetota bacterium]